ncbi:MAG TPA: DUF3048 domain-containing protein [Actinomycetes bacterium]
MTTIAATHRLFARRARMAGAVALSLGVAACSSSFGVASPPSPTPPAPVNTVAPPVATTKGIDPLTGTAGEIGPAVAVKVANTKEAWPQSGVSAADQVWVEEIEGGHLRLVAIYASSYPAKIGPVRSARETDIGLVPQFGKPGFAYAGADTPVLADIARAATDGLLVDLGKDAKVGDTEVRGPSYSTDQARSAPYNFYANGIALAGFASVGGAHPPASGGFAFGKAAAGSSPCTRLTATWAKQTTGGAHWDAASKSWVLEFDDKDLIDRETGKPLTATNVVVLRMYDSPSTKDRSNYQVPVLESYAGAGGDAILMRGGRCTTGHWSRPTQTSPTTLTTSGGAPLRLAPGRSWVFTVGIGPSLYDATERTATTS